MNSFSLSPVNATNATNADANCKKSRWTNYTEFKGLRIELIKRLNYG